MKKYAVITLKLGDSQVDIYNGIMEFNDSESLIVLVEKCTHNLDVLLEQGITFGTEGNSYRFKLPWETIWGVIV